MKKLFFTMAVIAGAMFFASCEEEAVQEVMAEITGKAACSVDGGDEITFSASMAMTKEGAEKANPYTIGLSMKMTINELLHLQDSNSIIFPMLAYRLTGTVSAGDVFTVHNYITAEDVINFDYRSLIDGKFAGTQLVGMATSKTKYFLMKDGTINITEASSTKISGTFNGTAYTIDRLADPMVDFDQSVPFSGSFQSRCTTMLGWIINMQSEDEPEGE